MQRLRILYQDGYLIAVEKPPRLPVHPPEKSKQRAVNFTSFTAMGVLKRQVTQWIYPVHRLDQATGGVLLFALSKEVAAKIQEQFKSHSIQKTYVALVRGWTEDRGSVSSPLKKLNGNLVEAHTDFETLSRIELSVPSSKHSTSRYSLVKVLPQTGRYHQIRRHFKHLSHPLIGDTVYGDGKQNQIWRRLTGDQGLYLKAYSLALKHPVTNENLFFRSRWNGFWQRAFDVAQVCPFIVQKEKVTKFVKVEFRHESEA